MEKNSVIFFDFDGTIADTMSHLTGIMNRISGEFGFKKIKKEDLEELKGERTKDVFGKIGIPIIRIPVVLKKTRQILTGIISKIKPIQGMPEVLNLLKEEGYKLGIITSAPKESVDKFLEKNGLNLFDFIYSEGNIFGKDKVMTNIMKEKNLNPKQVFYVGDETRDIEAAKRAGIKTIAVTWGFNNEKILLKESPDHLIKKPADLLEILRKKP